MKDVGLVRQEHMVIEQRALAPAFIRVVSGR
jgi:hypothetical protein